MSEVAFDPAAYLDKKTSFSELPEVKPDKLTYYYPETPENTAKAGLSYKMEGGIRGGPGFSDLDLRQHTLEMYDKGKSDYVATAMPGIPSGEKFRMTIGGVTRVHRNVDTGGGLVSGQTDIATSNPDLARGGGYGGGGRIRSMPESFRSVDPFELPEPIKSEPETEQPTQASSQHEIAAPEIPDLASGAMQAIGATQQPIPAPPPIPTGIGQSIQPAPQDTFSQAVQQATLNPPPSALLAGGVTQASAQQAFDPEAYLASKVSPTPTPVVPPQAQSAFDPLAYLAKKTSPSEVPQGTFIGGAVSKLGELVPGSVGDALKMIASSTMPFLETPHRIQQAYDVISGVPVDEAIPESVPLKRLEEIKQKYGGRSPEYKYAAGQAAGTFIPQELMAAGVVKGMRVARETPVEMPEPMSMPEALNETLNPVRGSGKFMRSYRIDKELGDRVEGIGAARESGALRAELKSRNLLSELNSAQEGDLGKYLVSRRLKTVNPEHPQILPEAEMNRIETDPSVAKALDYYKTEIKPDIEGWRMRAGLTEEAAAGKEAEFISLIPKTNEALPVKVGNDPIIAAAVRGSDGKVYTGSTHALAEASMPKGVKYVDDEGATAFVTKSGRILDTETTRQYAVKSGRITGGQIPDTKKILHEWTRKPNVVAGGVMQPGGVVRPGRVSRTTQFARPAEGQAKVYDTNLRDILRESYGEVIRKARVREFYDAVESKGIAEPSGKIVTFEDLPTELQHDFDAAVRVEPPPIGLSKLGRSYQRFVTGIALTANPAELMNHMRRQLSILAAKPPIGRGLVARLEALAPYFGPKLGAFKRAVIDDMRTPENQAILTDIFDAGGGSTRSFGSRYESKIPGLKQLQHKTTNLLFGVPKGRGLGGWDLRMRVQLEKIRRAAEGNVDPQRIREFSNQLGQYGSHPDWVIRGLRKINPYAATTLPMRVAEIKTAVGTSGLKSKTYTANALRRGETLLRGTGGTLLALSSANYLLSGKWPWENDAGHEFDLNTGLKNKDGKTVYVKLRAIAPELSRPVSTASIPNLLRERMAEHPQYGVAAAIGPANQLMSLVSGPGQNLALTATTGKVPYFLRRPGGAPELMDVAGLKKGEAEAGVSRFKRQVMQAAKGVNPFGEIFGPTFEVEVPLGLDYIQEPIHGIRPFGSIYSTSYEKKEKKSKRSMYFGR